METLFVCVDQMDGIEVRAGGGRIRLNMLDNAPLDSVLKDNYINAPFSEKAGVRGDHEERKANVDSHVEGGTTSTQMAGGVEGEVSSSDILEAHPAAAPQSVGSSGTRSPQAKSDSSMSGSSIESKASTTFSLESGPSGHPSTYRTISSAVMSRKGSTVAPEEAVDPLSFCGEDGMKVLEILNLLLRAALHEPERKFTPERDSTGPNQNGYAMSFESCSSVSAGPMLELLFSAFPSSAAESQILRYQGVVMNMVASVLSSELPKATSDVYRNATEMISLVLTQTISGVFMTSVIGTALDVALQVLRGVNGQRANSILGTQQQQDLTAKMVFYTQHLSVIALHRCSVNGSAAPTVLKQIRTHVNLLLPYMGSNASASSSSALNTSDKGRSPRFGTGMGGVSGALSKRSPSPGPSRINKAVVHDRVMGKGSSGGGGDLSERSGPFSMTKQATDDMLVLNLVGEMLSLLTTKDGELRQDLVHICSTLLLQRAILMRRLLVLDKTEGMPLLEDQSGSSLASAAAAATAATTATSAGTSASSTQGGLQRIDIYTNGFDRLLSKPPPVDSFMLWLDGRREHVRLVLEAAAVQSQLVNPELAMEVPSMAIQMLRSESMRLLQAVSAATPGVGFGVGTGQGSSGSSGALIDGRNSIDQVNSADRLSDSLIANSFSQVVVSAPPTPSLCSSHLRAACLFLRSRQSRWHSM